MKFWINFVLFWFSCFAATESVTIVRPEGVLQKLNEVKTLVADYKVYKNDQTSLGHFLPLFRGINSIIIFDVFNSTVDVFKQTVARLGSSDKEIRPILEAENQNACVLSLLTSLEQIIEFTGYAISNCIDITDLKVFVITNEYIKDVEESSIIADNLPYILTNAFIGRNVFTQPEKIKARLQELYDIEISDDAETLERLLAKSNDFAFGWHDEYFAVKSCLDKIENDVKIDYDNVKAKLPQC